MFRRGPAAKHAFADPELTAFPSTACCRVLRISRAGFYRWRTAEVSERRRREGALDAEVRQAFDESFGIY